MIPSKAKLEQAFPGHGAKLRGLLSGDIDPLTYPAVAQWAAQCYNAPRDSELVEKALDAELGTHGTEAIRGDMWNRFYCDAVAIYLNTGDTYATTLIFDIPARRWIVASLGSFVESKQRTYGIQ
jgi:hypothetical protein